MYKCNDCSREFEEYDTFRENSGEKWYVCPYCRGTDFDEIQQRQAEPYDPDLAEVSRKIIQGIFRINNFIYQLEDIFGDKLKNEELDEAVNSLTDALNIIFAPEGLDSYAEGLICKAKITDDSLKKATDNFLEGAGLI